MRSRFRHVVLVLLLALVAAITGKVIEAQSLKVDTVSGAAYSSRVILKAIENALRPS